MTRKTDISEEQPVRELWLLLLGSAIANPKAIQLIKDNLDVLNAPKDLAKVFVDILDQNPASLIKWMEVRNAKMGDGRKALDAVIDALRCSWHRHIMRDVASQCAYHQCQTLKEYTSKLARQLDRLKDLLPQETANDPSHQPQ